MRIQKLITLWALFVILLVLSTPWLLNTDYVKTEIIEFISHKTHKKIELNTIKLALFPKPYLKIDKISIPLPQDKNLTIGQVQIYPDMYDLIKGDINIKKISIKESLVFLAHTGEKTAPSPFPPFSIFNNLPAAQKDCLIVIKNLSSSNFRKVNGSIVVSPCKKEISGKILIKNITMDDPEKGGLTFGEKIKSCSGDQLKTVFTYKNPGEIDLHVTGKSLRLTAQNKEKIQGTNFSVKISVTKKRTMVILEPFILDSPLMNISINFLKNKDKNKIELSFNGKNINIDETKKTALTLFPNNQICKTIFDILPKGNISDLIVSFSGTAMDNLFDAKKMVIKGSIDHGRVNIPETLLVVNDFNGDVIVKNGILHTKVSNGIVEKTVIKNGAIGVDLLNSSYDFNGRFNLFANLERLPHVLADLLPDTKLAEELKLCHGIYGKADAVLILKSSKNNLAVSVKAKEISLKGEYQCIPGKISINRGNFSYNDNFVNLDNLDGYINKSLFHDLCASITLDGEHLLNITSGEALIDMETCFPWLVSFKKIDQMLSPLKSVKGGILLDSINIKGPILKPGKLQYNLNGSCQDLVLGNNSLKNEISALSCRFSTSREKTTISDICADISDTGILTALAKVPLINSLSMPLSISKAIFKLNKTVTVHSQFTDCKRLQGAADAGLRALRRTHVLQMPDNAMRMPCERLHKTASFKGNLLFKKGPELFIDITDNSGSYTINRLKINKKEESNGLLLIENNKKNFPFQEKPFFKIKGKIDTRTLEKIVKPDSPAFKKIRSLTHGNNYLIESDKESNITISTDYIDINEIMQNLYNCHGQPLLHTTMITVCDEEFPKKKENKIANFKFPEESQIGLDSFYPNWLSYLPSKFQFKADLLKYKKLMFSPFAGKINFSKNSSRIVWNNSRLCNINTSGSINKTDDSILININLNAEKKELGKVVPCLFSKKEIIKGEYSISGKLSSHGEMDKINENFHGNIDFYSNNGRIYKLTLLSRILSIINISRIFQGKLPDITQDGFAYNAIEINANIEKSQVFLKNAVINGTDMTLIFNGSMDFYNNEMDMTCLVAPFKTADILIKHIPVLGSALDGRLISIPVKITGKINDPKVILLSPIAIGKEFSNTILRILKTPFKIMESLP